MLDALWIVQSVLVKGGRKCLVHCKNDFAHHEGNKPKESVHLLDGFS